MAADLPYFDISPEISTRTAVFPGDLSFKRNISQDFAQGDHLLLSSIQMTLHIGAHTDAPNHYHPEGQGIGDRALDPYLGACQVISVTLPRGERIRPKDFTAKITAARVLFKTRSFPDP